MHEGAADGGVDEAAEVVGDGQELHEHAEAHHAADQEEVRGAVDVEKRGWVFEFGDAVARFEGCFL